MVFKTQFVYQCRWGIMTSFNFQSQSGKPIYSEIRASRQRDAAFPARNRVVADRDRRRGLRTDTGRRSTPASRSRSRLGGTAELAAFGDFLNLFNSDANESVLDRRPGNANYLVPSRFIAPRRLMIGAKFRF